MSRFLVPILALALTNSVGGSTLPEPVRAAFAHLAGASGQAWAYTRETRDDTGHYLERFDPELPHEQQWRLLEFDGKPPTGKQLRRYRKRYEGLFDRDSPVNAGVDELIDVATVVEHTRTDDSIVYRFEPRAHDSEEQKIMKYLRGKLVIDKPDNRLRSLQLHSTQEFSPVAMMRVIAMSMQLDFAAASDRDPSVVVAARSRIEGRFMGIRHFTQEESVHYRDFALRE